MRVGVNGAAGQMGSAVCACVEADPDLVLVAAVDRVADGAAPGDGVVARMVGEALQDG